MILYYVNTIVFFALVRSWKIKLLISKMIKPIFIIVFISSLSVFGQSNKIPNSRIRDRSVPLTVHIPDRSYKKMQEISLPEVQTQAEIQLFNECYYCQKENRLWYSSPDKLCSAVNRCDYDYLEIRFDQMFYLKNITLLVMVFCSYWQTQIDIDSIVYIQQDIESITKKKIYVNGRRMPLTIPTVPNGIGIGNRHNMVCEKIRTLFASIENFHSMAEYCQDLKDLKYQFFICGKTYRISQGRFYADTSDGASLPAVQPSKKKEYFRLGIFGKGSDCTPIAQTEKSDELILKARDHYIFNQCIVDYEVTSKIGAVTLRLYCDGLIDKEIKFNGDHLRSGSIPIGFGERQKILSIVATDKGGNKVEKQLVVFSKIEQQKKEMEKHREQETANETWARQSIFNATVDFMSRWQGNIISLLLEAYREGQIQEFLLRRSDILNSDSCQRISLPSLGYALNIGPLKTRIYTYSVLFPYTEIVMAGTRISTISLDLSTTLPKTQSVHIYKDIPLGQGYFLPRYVVKKENSLFASGANQSLIVCSDIECSNSTLQMTDIPFIMKKPVNKVDFATFITLWECEADDMVLTYVVKLIDRSEFILQRSISLEGGSDSTNKRITGKGVRIDYRSRRIEIQHHGCGILSQEQIHTEQKLLELYIFLYSIRQKSTIGAGCLWVQN